MPPRVTVTADLTLPGTQIPRLPSGSVVRRARARLYYLDVRDQLIRLDLLMPRAPAIIEEIAGGEVLATGVQNMQLGCELANADGTLGACGGALGAGNEIATESAAFFGTFEAGGGPVLEDASSLRTIVLNVTARSARPLLDVNGDASEPLNGVELAVGEGADPAAAYVAAPISSPRASATRAWEPSRPCRTRPAGPRAAPNRRGARGSALIFAMALILLLASRASQSSGTPGTTAWTPRSSA